MAITRDQLAAELKKDRASYLLCSAIEYAVVEKMTKENENLKEDFLRELQKNFASKQQLLTDTLERLTENANTSLRKSRRWLKIVITLNVITVLVCSPYLYQLIKTYLSNT